MRREKRCLALLLVLILSLQLLPAVFADGGHAPKRVIHLVYDDSGSMIRANGEQVDRWCQAKYAMEVFAAMLGENDTMNIYYMSAFEGNGSRRPTIRMAGKDGAQANVAKIHDTVTKAGNTPFASVTAAYQDLTRTDADERWLVVLTDGEFQGVDSISAYFSNVPPSINVMFLSMGPDAPDASAIVPAGHENIFFAKAASSADILNQITGICTRVFNSNKLTVEKNKFSFDIPMSQLVVFAQGQNVQVRGIKGPDGELIGGAQQAVGVRYSETAAPNYTIDPGTIPKNLVGSVVAFDGAYDAGDYTLDISGAETVEIYYKPNVEISAYLTDDSGEEVTDLEKLKAGSYTIHFGFVKAGTQEKVAESKLLGNVDYSAVIEQNGVPLDGVYTNGSTLQLEDGTIRIRATARYLDYNSVTTTLEYTIYKDRAVAFAQAEPVGCMVTKSGLQPDGEIVLHATLDGQEMTPEQWAAFPTPTAKLTGGSKKDYTVTVEKGEAIGTIVLTPQLKQSTPQGHTYEDLSYRIRYAEKLGDEVWAGDFDGSVAVRDQRSWLARNRTMLSIALAVLLVLLLLAKHFFRKRFPKAMKRRPLIEVDEIVGLDRQKTALPGSFRVQRITKVFGPEKGTLKFSGSAMVPALQVTAVGGGKMMITNASAYAGRTDVKFDNNVIEAGTKKYVISCRTTIEHVEGEGEMRTVYTCTPAAEYKSANVY